MAKEVAKRKIPKFKSEEEEIHFWDTHSLADYWDDTEEVREPIQVSEELRKKIIKRRENKQLLTIRIEKDLIEKAKKVARKKAIGYQTQMRMWIAEGIQREKAN
ncbi:MAG: CopG family antitoxin [Thermodesulfobacteriota bacterium]|nr:CopG family antitoxin [Thermodesulfobacteriota bacterium]